MMNARGSQRDVAATHEGASAEHLTGAVALVKSLAAVEVEVLFGLPGGAILPAYDALFEYNGIRHVLMRHEQAAGHAARGYAQATERVGVCVVTSGPGATNLVTPLADAYRDSIPLVAITGQVPSAALGTDAFQEIDILGITLPITKHGFSVTAAEQIPEVVAEAFHLAASGRPGPVVIDICKDALQQRARYRAPAPRSRPPFAGLMTENDTVADILELLGQASRPVLYVGGGIIRGGASGELKYLAEQTGIPVVTTLMGLGAFPDGHRLHMGMPGMHGHVSAVGALQQSDLLIAVGARFDDRVTGAVSGFAPGAKVVHIDIDATEISKVRRADVAIVGDCKKVLAELGRAVARRSGDYDFEVWRGVLEGYRREYRVGSSEPPGSERPSAAHVLRRLSELSSPDSLFTTGVGQHQMWAAQILDYQRPGSLITSGGLGTMGFAVPAALGAGVGRPGSDVWAIDGDGCFLMTQYELATCVAEQVPIKIAVINNGSLGMVRQWQTLFYGERYSHTTLDPTGYAPDFVRLAEAYGCVGLRCAHADDLDRVIGKANQTTGVPVLIDFVVSPDEMVWPMVPPGASNDEIEIARNRTPVWEQIVRKPADVEAIADSPEASYTIHVVARDMPHVTEQITKAVRRCGFRITKLLAQSDRNPGIVSVTLAINRVTRNRTSVADYLRALVDVITCRVLDAPPPPVEPEFETNTGEA